MEQLPKNQVSLRGASVKEITRDALLEKVFQERELRQYARRAAAAALFVQRVWRRYKVTRTVALQLQEEWENLVNNNHTVLMKGAFISSDFLRPFLFFFKCLSTPSQKIRTRDIDCAKNCFKILLESISSTESKNNFCSLAIGTPEERRLWTYQARKLVSLCLSILSQFDRSHAAGQEIVALTSLGMRVVVVLTDSKGWKNITESSRQDADVAVKDLVQFLGTSECGLYLSIRRYMSKLDVPLSSQNNSIIKTDEKFVITASGITLALRPFYATNFDLNCPATWEGQNAAEQYCLFLLTIPWLAQRLPALLLPALKHKSILRPCLWTLLVLKDKILLGISGLDQSTVGFGSKVVPPVGWTLANIICLVTGSDKNSVDIGWFKQDSDYALYVRVSLILAENLLVLIEDAGLGRKENQDIQVDVETSSEYTDGIVPEGKNAYGSLRTSYIELLKPVCQQSHLTNLLTIVNTDASSDSGSSSSSNMEYLGKLGMLDIAYFYSFMLRIFSRLNPLVGSSPILNVLSFTPGFLTNLWGALEGSLFRGDSQDPSSMMMSGLQKDVVLERKKKKTNKDGANKWATMLHKLTSKQQEGYTLVDTADDAPPNHCQIDKSSSDVWDVESVRHGPQGISKDISCLLYLFSATYSHLLLVLDDIEFYEKQIPFTLEQQRRIASMLNTLVYNGLSHGTGLQNRSLMESAIRCLHLMYERDCRHRFCPPALWLSPARKSRPPVAVAARTHEVLSSTLRSDDVSTLPTLGSVITTTAHIFPFEERVEMFREFVKMDKVSRKMSGEDAGPGSRPVEISIRRSHIVEDGFRQLNSLGSKLKSSIHVTFVSECGLPEAGLDCGGLSKELLTDIAKAAFGPEYGLFSQTSTLDRLLIPNASARCIENGIHMIEFLGRVVGKALYEGILLEYSFSHVFVQKLLGRYSFLDELSTLDPELYRNLMYVKHYDGDVKDLSLDFTVTEDSFGKRHVIELKHGGKDVSVTNENKLQYVHAMADYKLNRQILPYSNAFYRGLTDLISPSWLKLFNASEFNQLLSGGNHDIDVDDLRNNTKYTGGYTEGSRTVKLFWEVMKSFEAKDRCMVLKFVTSCSRGPLLGFKHLQPNFTIHKIICDVPIWASIGGQDVERLPSASTCYNTLKLPTYKRSSTLREKLLYAINSNAGFELS